MSKFPLCCLMIVGFAGSFLNANAATQGLAIPQEMLFDMSGNLVGEVHLTVQWGWLNAPHAVDITITSVDGQPFHDHGQQIEALSSLDTIGDVAQGVVDVVVPWITDQEPKRVDDLYTVCAHIIFADNHHGEDACKDFGPF